MKIPKIAHNAQILGPFDGIYGALAVCLRYMLPGFWFLFTLPVGGVRALPQGKTAGVGKPYPGGGPYKTVITSKKITTAAAGTNSAIIKAFIPFVSVFRPLTNDMAKTAATTRQVVNNGSRNSPGKALIVSGINIPPIPPPVW